MQKDFFNSIGQNENRRFSGLCQLTPAADIYILDNQNAEQRKGQRAAHRDYS